MECQVSFQDTFSLPPIIMLIKSHNCSREKCLFPHCWRQQGWSYTNLHKLKEEISAVLLLGEEEQRVERKKESLCYEMTSLVLWKSQLLALKPQEKMKEKGRVHFLTGAAESG